MIFGVHAFIWTARWSEQSLNLIEKIRDLGFQLIEIPLLRLDLLNPEKVKERLQDTGLQCSCSTGLSSETDISSPDTAIRTRGVTYLKECIQASYRLGAKVFSGVIYSAFAKNVGRPPLEEEWQYAADSLREVARLAREYGIVLAIEPINRYESYLVNTAQQGEKLQKLIDEPNVGINLDTYHMNIEEKDFYSPIKMAGKHLYHIHLSENDRGIPGTGHVDWNGVFRALKEIGYQGAAVMESFVSPVPEMAAATCIWRQLAPDGDTLAREGLNFLRSKAKQYGLI